MSEDLFVVSAPSGAGKTTLIRRMLERVPDLEFSISFTTRPRRAAEREGVDYHFVEEGAFDRMVREGSLLEWAEVHGQRYGTSARLVDAGLARGNDVLLDVDSQGAASVKRLRPSTTLIFVLPPDFETLRRRLEGRGNESPAEIARRLEHARGEIQRFGSYDFLIINNDLDDALVRLQAVVLAQRCRRDRQEEACRRIAAGFRAA